MTEQLVAVECHNEAEWNAVKKKVKSTLGTYNTYMRDQKGPICINGNCWCPTVWYVEHGYTIIQACDFLKAEPTIINNYSII